MAIILLIDTALELASVAICNNEKIILSEKNEEPIQHAAFVQPAIKNILDKTNINLNQIDAVAVNAGPGSYTGLRVGLSSAKGICFVLNKPLILINTLTILAKQVILEIDDKDALYCPMIDARRMEVFTALYDYYLNEIVEPSPIILTEQNFLSLLQEKKKKIIFSGTGIEKMKPLTTENNFIFYKKNPSNEIAFNQLAQQYFSEKKFADLAYSEPLYTKNFFSSMAKKS